MFKQSNAKAAAKPVNASVNISLSSDLLEARLYIVPPEAEGEEATPKTFDDALAAAKVSFGIDAPLLQQLKMQPQYNREFHVARGIAPVAGTDGDIKYCFEVKTESHPKERADGTVDYRDLGLVVNVQRGQVLAQITLPTKGTEGMSVTGKKLLPVPGKAVPSPAGRNTELSPDGTQLLATVDGHVSRNGARVNVVDTFIVSGDVDTATGNIKSVCNVSVVGSVTEGFAIEAAGSVDIGGNISGGDVKCGGNLSVHGGIVGMGRSKVECGGSLQSTFLENCEASVGGSVKAESIMNCRIKCAGKLELAGLRAKLMGGRFIVGGDVIANEIGSVSNLPTELVLGADPAVMTRYSALAAEKKQLAEQIEKLKQIVDLLGKYEQAGVLPQSKRRMLLSSRVSLDASAAKLDADSKEYDNLSAQIENSGKGKVICRGTLYRGVKLTIGFTSMNVDNDITSSSLALVDDKIVATPASSY